MQVTEIFVVRCEGCSDFYLAGMGGDSDPAEDVTYNPDTRTFICGDERHGCYSRQAAIRGEYNTTLRKKVNSN